MAGENGHAAAEVYDCVVGVDVKRTSTRTMKKASFSKGGVQGRRRTCMMGSMSSLLRLRTRRR